MKPLIVMIGGFWLLLIIFYILICLSIMALAPGCKPQATNMEISRWEVRWAHDKYDLGKKYKGVENKSKRPIIAFVVDQKILGNRIVYIEMSSHPETLTPNMSIKVREWIQDGVKKESWVLVNRFGILRTKHFLHLQKHNHNVDSEYRQQIIDKFLSIVQPN